MKSILARTILGLSLLTNSVLAQVPIGFESFEDAKAKLMEREGAEVVKYGNGTVIVTLRQTNERWEFHPGRKDTAFLVPAIEHVRAAEDAGTWRLTGNIYCSEPGSPACAKQTEELARTLNLVNTNGLIHQQRLREGDEHGLLDMKCPSASAPRYPARWAKAGMRGSVTLKIQVTDKNEVGEIEVMKSSGFEKLDESAIAAARTFCVKAETSLGNPVSTALFWIPFDFNVPTGQ